MIETIDETKARLRESAKQARATAHAAAPDAASRLNERFFAAVDAGVINLPAGTPVSAYWPLNDEIDPRPLMAKLIERGHPVGLPVLVAKGEPLTFRSWQPGQALMQGSFGLREPGRGVPTIVPQVLLVPLLAFDRAGYRLGYGGGFYDRTLAKLHGSGRALSIGLAFSGQEVEVVPHDDMDERLDCIVTESELIPFEAEVVET